MAYKSLLVTCHKLFRFLVIISLLSGETTTTVTEHNEVNSRAQSNRVWAVLPKHIRLLNSDTIEQTRSTAKSPTVPRSAGFPPDRTFSRPKPRKHRRESEAARLRYFHSQFNRYSPSRTTALLYHPKSVNMAQTACPDRCTCKDSQVVCYKTGLDGIPKNIPERTEKLSITGNRILHIGSGAFKGLASLKSLILTDNQMQTIDASAFDGIAQLRRLRLDRNGLRQLPSTLLANLSQLHRLDLRGNRLECLPMHVFQGVPELRYLYLSDNQLGWISPTTFKPLHQLKYIDLHGNPFRCDCHLQKMLASIHANGMTFTDNQSFGVCTMQVDGRILDYPINRELLKLLHCPQDSKWLSPPTKSLEECLNSQAVENSCGTICDCSMERSVNCQRQAITKIPQDLPEDIVEINLSHNQLESLPKRGFSRYRQLRKIILDNNALTQVHAKTFEGLSELSSLYMSSNGLTSLPRGLFSDLKGLKILYLHQNQIACIQQDTFAGLKNLQILHLSNNRIRTFPPGCFTDLNRLQYLYLVNNPIVCDCRIPWLPAYLVEKEAGGTQWAQCAEPEDLRGHHIRDVSPSRLRCTAFSSYRAGHLSDCEVTGTVCPEGCTCRRLVSPLRGEPHFAQVLDSPPLSVDCSNLGLSEVPSDIPVNTRQLNMRNNQLTEISGTSGIASLGQLETLILDNNRIRHIDQMAFANNVELKTLIISNNSLTSIDHRILSGLQKLKILLLQHNQLSCLNSQTFRGTRSLKILMLNNNQLRCLAKGLFDGLQLDSLSLSANPLICDCHLSWLPDWLREQTATEPLPPTCVEPEELTGTPVASLSRYHFTCSKTCQSDGFTWPQSGGREAGGQAGTCQNECCAQLDEDENEAGETAIGCPKNCLCDSTSVYCSDLNLTQIPSRIPEGTRQLYLERNQIAHILPDRLQGLNKLHTLVLSYNLLSELQERLFENLVNLKTLVLSHNNIQCIHQDAFKGLRALRVLILQANNISSIPYGAFQELGQLNNIALGQNPLHCDCNGKWLNSFFRQHFLDNGIALCHSPASMKHKSIYHSRPSDFVCPWNQRRGHHGPHAGKLRNLTQVYSHLGAHFEHDDNADGNEEVVGFADMENVSSVNALRVEMSTGVSVSEDERESLQVAARCLPCLLKPCGHGGLCTPIGQLDYQCSCSSPYRGRRCELFEDACAAKPCLNGGVCEVSSDNTDSYRCICPAGFRGVNCAEKIETCRQNVCLNGGVCELVGEGHRCHCPTGYHGKICENVFKFCTELNPCVNGGKCISQPGNKYRCECVPGWSGKNCDLNEDDCLYNKCENGATCLDGINEYICKCRPGYAGMFCEQSTWNPVAHVTRMDKTLPLQLERFRGNTWQSPQVRHSPIKTRSLSTPRLESLCAYHQCQNKATCRENRNSLYTCVCLPGFSGQFCEYLSSVSLPSPHSYVAIVPPSRGALVPRGSISMLLATESSDGILVYYGDVLQTSGDPVPEQYLLVYLQQGRLHAQLSLNASDVTKRQSEKLVNDGVQHKVELLVEKANVTILVDDLHQMKSVSKEEGSGGSLTPRGNHLALNYPLYFGGAPADRLDVAGRILGQSRTLGVRGCLHDIRINNRQVDLAKLFGAPVDKLLVIDTQSAEKPSAEARYHGTAIGIVPGCPATASHSDSQTRSQATLLRGGTKQTPAHQSAGMFAPQLHDCSKNTTCRNGGYCQPSWANGSLVGFACICPEGFTGRLCHIMLNTSCRASGQRSYYRDPKTNCISVRKLKVRHCSGECAVASRNKDTIEDRVVGRYLFKRNGDANHMDPLLGGRSGSSQTCCQGSKVKYRRVRFVCPTGASYEKTVRLVKRCACLPCPVQRSNSPAN